jgi:hypothetical protein
MMRLYVNGDSHAAAAEAVNQHAFANDDGRYFYMGRVPHPDNLQVSWGNRLSQVFKTVLYCDAESASSNDRIIRTTLQWIEEHPGWCNDTLMLIQWSTWEREEWQGEDGVHYQVNASGIDDVPVELQQQYKEFVANIDWQQCTTQSHEKIWAFHQQLNKLNIQHVFFNGNSHFAKIPLSQQHDWGVHYIDPYNPESTFDSWLRRNGFGTVSPDSWHFGEDAHRAWQRFMLQYIINNNLA